MISSFTKTLMFISFLFLLSGCASVGKAWRSFIGADKNQPKVAAAQPSAASFNKQNNLLPETHRQYKRTKRKDLEDDAHLDSKAGSLWVMEGQGAYLFSQNTVRMIGDPIGVTIEGEPQEQLSAKSNVIRELLTQIEERRRRALGRGPAGEKKPGEANAPNAQNASAGAPGADPANPAAQNLANPTNTATQPGAESNKDFNVKTVPTRVVERLVDGNYRVRGMQPFMIGSREYKVIVSGIVRAEDFNEDGISASQLLDSNFDIVSSKNTEIK